MNQAAIYLFTLVLTTTVWELIDPLTALLQYIYVRIFNHLKKRSSTKSTKAQKTKGFKNNKVLAYNKDERLAPVMPAGTVQHAKSVPTTDKSKRNDAVMNKIKNMLDVEIAEFDTPRRMISLIYFQSIMWICLPFIPFAVVVCALINLFLFKYQRFFLFRVMRKPKQAFSAMDTGIFFIALYLLTFGFAIISFYYLMNVNQFNESQCTLVSSSDNTALGMLRDYITTYNNNALTNVYNHIITNSLLVWIIVVIVYGVSYAREKSTKAMKNYANMLLERLNKEQKTFEDKMTKLKDENSTLKKRLDFSKQD
ncbi:hypothetical protein AKO1_009108 [Acrasis kona]|uniref:3 TM domain-containing transmembrane protein n=1 Tax=Acrasis kona TaxID=1008807 RepID=A0AAW2ZJ51_9EUKA